jgi:hypothetical protein
VKEVAAELPFADGRHFARRSRKRERQPASLLERS